MLRVNGFYGHVQRNDLRSTVLFLGFLLAFQILAAVVLCLPLMLVDYPHAPVHLSGAYLGRYGPLVLAVSTVLFSVQFLRHAASLRSSLAIDEADRHTQPRLCRIVEVQALAAGVPVPRVGVIDSQARNAFACGLSVASAMVVVTQGLIEALDDDELAAVVAHEIVHIRNRDIRLMAAADVLLGNLMLLQRLQVLRFTSPFQVVLILILFWPLLIPMAVASFGTNLAVTIARLSRLLISASREFVADAEAVRLTHNPAALISALRRIEGRSVFAGTNLRTAAMMID